MALAGKYIGRFTDSIGTVMDIQKIMIVEDEVVVSTDLQAKLEKLGYSVDTVVRYGEKVIESALRDQPDLVLMDIKLKGKMDGVEAARILQKRLGVPIVFLTAFTDDTTLKRAKVTGPFGYLKKPVRLEELRINIEIALYKSKMERERDELIRKLQAALAEIKTLSGLLPICASCKKIRDDKGYWNQIETYIREHSDAEFTHSICPDCIKKLYPNLNNTE